MTRLRINLALFLTIWLLSPALAVSGSVYSVSTETEYADLSKHVDWCSDTNKADTPADTCRFTPAQSGDLSPGYSRNTFWLRFSLDNHSEKTLERWLSIGHPRLEQVSLFEAQGARRQQTDSGLLVPTARRPLAATDIVFPLHLAPGEKKELLIRIASRTTIDLTPSLWEPNAYRRASTKHVITQSLGLGGLAVIAILALLIWLRSKNRLYLYFAGTGLGRSIYMAAFTGLLPFFLWPENLPFDIRMIMIGAGCAILFYVPFVRGIVGEFRRNPWANSLLLAMGGVAALAMLWTLFADYGAVQIMMFASMADFIIGVYLFYAAWRRGNNAAGYMVIANALFLLIQGVVFTISLGGATFNQLAISFYVWGSLLGAPLILIGLAAHGEDLRERLLLAQAESAARVAFLARMSHELRTPLDTILGTTQLLARTPANTEVASGLADIAKSGWRLLRMIDDILDYARGLSGRLAIIRTPVNLASFLRSVGNNARLLAERNGNAFHLNEPSAKAENFWLDDGRLRQVLDNLLTNAARYTRNGWLRLDCEASACQESQRWRLSFAVSDSGDGIALEDQERIFRPFERGENRTRQDGKGIGLGLAIARQLVEMMGGEITVTSKLDEGACFRFHVFADLAESSNAENPVSGMHSGAYLGRQRTLLVVDDTEKNRQIVAALLQNNGFAVVQAESGQEVIDLCAARAEAVDLVLTDQFMADGDGWSVLLSIERHWPGVPTILMSAAPPERPADFPSGLDFAASLLKPLDHTTLLKQIAALLALEWRDSHETIKQPQPPSLLSESRPSPDELQTLAALVATGQISAILEWAETIRIRSPDCAKYAEQVINAAQNLDFASLRQYTLPNA